VIIWESLLDAQTLLLTANTETVYGMAVLDLRETDPRWSRFHPKCSVSPDRNQIRRPTARVVASAVYQMGSSALRAEDGIRTRGPHLGKVLGFVHGVRLTPYAAPPSTEFAPSPTELRPRSRAVYYQVASF
jgi:hypothetical protein